MIHILLFVFVCLALPKDAAAFLPASTGLGDEQMIGMRGPSHPASYLSTLGAERDSSSSLYGSVDKINGIDHVVPSNELFFEVLQDAIYLNSTKASSVLLSKITEISDKEVFLNNLLALGPDAPLPIWTRFRFLAKFSQRARMASLRRTLDQMSPGDTDRKKETVDSRLQRRRRALVSLLRSLSEEGEISNEKEDDVDNVKCLPAIYNLEKKATKASKDSPTTSRRPADLETPEYEVISAVEDKTKFEIRRYKPYSVCSVNMGKPRPKDSIKTDEKIGSPEFGGASSFGALAGYLFGKNDKSLAMKMTTPVQTSMEMSSSKTEDFEGDRQMEFILPSDYWGTEKMKTAPMPLEGSGVTLIERDSEERAVIMFGGYASKKEAEKRKKELLSALKRDSKWKPVENTETLAQYNDPFTVPWRRLNEVSVKVVQR
jgi:hypothetical protein